MEVSNTLFNAHISEVHRTIPKCHPTYLPPGSERLSFSIITEWAIFICTNSLSSDFRESHKPACCVYGTTHTFPPETSLVFAPLKSLVTCGPTIRTEVSLRQHPFIKRVKPIYMPIPLLSTYGITILPVPHSVQSNRTWKFEFFF